MAGYSGKPLADKIGLKPAQQIAFFNAPIGYPALLGPALKTVSVVDPPKAPLDLVQVFAITMVEMRRSVKKARTLIHEDGVIWVSWPKKASGWKTDITEDAIREYALGNQLVDIKVCAVDDVWSALKLVTPVAQRNKKSKAAKVR
jgi:hypothetical protein